MDPAKSDILALSRDDRAKLLLGIGWEPYRVRQLEEWLWKHGVRHFADMRTLPAALRTQLQERFCLPGLTCALCQQSVDGTSKFKFLMHDGLPVESVLIPSKESDRYTLCVSSQSGCSLSCAFCATGTMGLLRNLTASEIYDQYLYTNRFCDQQHGLRIGNIVYMGMGEPLLNYKNVLGSIDLLTSPSGASLSPKRITVSTAGIAKMIERLADDGVRVNLALSLHAADDEKRSRLMPINESNRLSTLLGALKYFYQKTGNRISYEYIAFQGFNDSDLDARKLVRLCSHFPVRVNIIEYNPVAGMSFVKSDEDRINGFAREVRKHGIMITVRRSRGKDIDAACGQLAARPDR
ncbi:MAG: 23S rRNA (adenine(2503)-C(2))-methyltransferase RlmN [Saprospiraceae bacterium]|nr:23S rRNA (adenine(2503)-C(2))-methyltransferase RlmN [Saprospiraceae bacterium]